MKKFIDNKDIKTDIYRTEASDSIICEYNWFSFIDFMLKVKSLLDYANIVSPN